MKKNKNSNKASRPQTKEPESKNISGFFFLLFCLFAEPQIEEVTDKIKIPIIKEIDRVMKYLMNMTEMAAVSLCLV